MFKRTAVTVSAAALAVAAAAGVASAWTQGDPANDLLYFRMDDRSVHHLGENQVWVEWKIKNLAGDSNTHSYTWTWQAVRKSDGVVLNTGTQVQANVKPGKTVTGEAYTGIVNDDAVKLVVTSLTRTP
jgi:hypothetical protein